MGADRRAVLQPCRISLDLDRRIKASARANRRSVSAEIRALLEAGLQDEPQPTPDHLQPLSADGWDHL